MAGVAAQGGPRVDLMAVLGGLPEWGIDVATAAVFLAWFYAGCQLYKSEKQRAYVVAVLNASACIAAGFYVCHYEMGWDFSKGPWMLEESLASRLMVRFFRVAQILDVVLGLCFYPSQLFFLTTWVHHTAYTLLCNWMLSKNVSVLFAICLVEELPTLIMSLGRIDRSLRTDAGFGATYLLLRIALHTQLCYGVMTYETDDDRIAVIRFNFMLTWCLHVNWFWGFLKQQARLWRQSARARGGKSD